MVDQKVAKILLRSHNTIYFQNSKSAQFIIAFSQSQSSQKSLMAKKLKLVIIGSQMVGKSSIIMRIIERDFKSEMATTVGMDFKSEKRIINNEPVLIELWDTTGQDKFKAIVKCFFREADGIFLVFDLTNKKSLQDLDFWMNEISNNLAPEVPMILLGNKSDLIGKIPSDIMDRMSEICKERNCKWYSTSAKKGTNLDEAFNELVAKGYSYISKYKQQVAFTQISDIQDPKPKKKKKECC